ncbi:MAG: hypothetical protein FWH36_06895 [Lentimicrobiaceae bacterium]|nr:hypothetical protein [Lentimicrobiaceae bacterium]
MKPKHRKKNNKKSDFNFKNRPLFKYFTIVYLAVISIVFFINYNATFDEKVNLNGDNIHYYSLGKALNEGKGFTNTMELTETPHTHFPPGYPFFISLLMKCGISSIHGIKVANGFLLYASLILLYFILAHFAKNRLVAFVSVFFTAIHSQLLAFACIMMSEMLFMLLLCVVLFLILHFPPDKLFVNKRKRLRDIAIMCALAGSLGYIYLVRTMGLTIILAVIAYFGVFTMQKLILYFKTRKNQEVVKQNKITFIKYGLVLILTVVSLLVPKTAWDMRDKMVEKQGNEYVSDFLKQKRENKMETIADWKNRLKNNTSNYITKYFPSSVLKYDVKVDFYMEDTGKYPSIKEWILGLLFLVLLLFGVIKSRNGLLLFFYVGISLFVLLVWPEQYGGYRYMLPIIPFLIFLFFNGIANIIALLCRIRKKIDPLIAQIVIFFICACFMYPSYIKGQEELRTTAKLKTWEKANIPKMNKYLEACKFCKENLPDSIRVITRKPEIFYMFSGYKKSTSFPWDVEPDTIIAHLKNQNATHIILDDWFRHAYTTLFPAVQKYPEKFKVLKEIGKADTATKENPTYVLEFNDEWGYHGERVNGQKTGEGYEFFQDGRKYAGSYENNVFHGNGTLYDENGNVLYKGYWRNGRIIKGEGELDYSDGRKYIGQFNNNIPDGYGTMYDTSGKVISKGKWQNGILTGAN